ncbi:MAG TPA: oligosaccharide flippase family protein [Prosthecobacter sp.]|nr:oligosaccharide flippase family protein [Prosthecobacter sp.]
MTTVQTKSDYLPRKIGSSQFVPTFATSLAIQVCTVVQGILLARILGSEGRGQFAAATLWPMFFAAIGQFGITVVLSRRAAHADDLPRVMRTAIFLSFITGTITAAVCAAMQLGLLAQADAVVVTAAYVFTPFILFNHIALSVAAVDHGAGRLAEVNWTRLLVNPVYLLLLVMLWVLEVKELAWYVAALMTASVVVAVVRLALALRNAPLRGPVLPLRPLAREALPYGAMGLMSPVLQTADKALIFYFLGARDLGFYMIALTASSVINSLAAASGTISFGMAAQAHAREGFAEVAKMFRMSLLGWLCGGAALAVLMPFLLPLIYGHEFAAAVVPAIVLIPAAALAGQAGLLEEAMRAQGRPLVGLKGRVAGLLILVTAGWWLARTYGVVGMAVAAIVAQVVVMAVMVRAVREHYHEVRWRMLLPGFRDVADIGAYVRRRMQREKKPGRMV